jgi:hypothetical protein
MPQLDVGMRDHPPKQGHKRELELLLPCLAPFRIAQREQGTVSASSPSLKWGRTSFFLQITYSTVNLNRREKTGGGK